MTSRVDRISELERALDERGLVVSQRDQLQAELHKQLAENADLRQRNEQLQKASAARDAERGELQTLANVAKESLIQLTTRLGG